VLATGVAFAPTTAGVFASKLLAGRFVGKVGPRLVLTAAGLLTAVSLGGLLVIGPSTAFVTMLTPLITWGIGLGVLVPSMTATLLGAVETSRSGIASGALNTGRQTGSVIGVALFGALANGHLIDGLRLSLILSIALAVLTVAVSRTAGSETGD
jgi:MFS transporter, DHA2 family, methylenomycin A resistance protein